MKKTCKIDKFIYKHFQQTNHSQIVILFSLLKIFYDGNSTKIYWNIFRQVFELKWTHLLQTSHPLGLL